MDIGRIEAAPAGPRGGERRRGGPARAVAGRPRRDPVRASFAASLMALLAGLLTGLVRQTAADRAAAAAVDDMLAAGREGLVRHAADGAVVAVTSPAERLLGVRAASLLGDGLIRRVAGGDRPVYLRALADAIAGGASRTVTVSLATGATGLDGLEMPAARTVDVAFTRVAGGAVARLDDAAERLATAAETARLTAALAAQEALRQRLVATLCHEIRTPLNAVLGFADALGEASRAGRCPPALVEEYAALIGEAGRHLSAVTGDLVDAAHPGEGEHAPQAIDLAALAAGCRRMLAPAAEAAGLILDLVVAADLPPVHADPRACRQILINLVSNAIKFTDRGGDVVIRLERVGSRVRLSVRDTGIGIAAEAIERLGTPYLRLPTDGRRREGAGLGLTVVKALAALHGGRLQIRSQPGRGTTASLDLPVADAAAAPPGLTSDGRSAG